jgi:DNA-entry nuclease
MKGKIRKKTAALLIALAAVVGCAAVQVNTGIFSETTAFTTTAAGAAGRTGGHLKLSSVPDYSGSPYVNVHKGKPYFTNAEMTTETFEKLSSLDSEGRCGTAYACIGRSSMPTGERGSIGMIKPAGWHTVRYSCVDGGYLYNRCHLIGWQLTGENAEPRNLITGTRYMNVEGMEPFENMVADYIEETGNHVMYRVTPMYKGRELLARGVEMEAKSVEDNGRGISFNVFCYNVQPGVAINYSTGASHSRHSSSDSSSGSQSSSSGSSSHSSAAHTYILNSNTGKFHRPSCSSVKLMKDSNKIKFHGTRKQAIAKGYSPCKNCDP